MPKAQPRRCTALTKSGAYCRAWAIRDTDPPRCAPHAGLTGSAGAPPGNRNAVKHGFYTAFNLDPDQTTTPILAVIQDLVAKQAQLSDLINQYLDDNGSDQIQTRTLVTLLQLHGQNASRLGRLLRDERALSGAAADGISGAIAQALDELSTEWGIEL